MKNFLIKLTVQQLCEMNYKHMFDKLRNNIR